MDHEVRAQVLIRKWLEEPKGTVINRAHLRELAIAVRDAFIEVGRDTTIAVLKMVSEEDSWIADKIAKGVGLSSEDIHD